MFWVVEILDRKNPEVVLGSYYLRPENEITIGRDEKRDIYVKDMIPSCISRRHARLIVKRDIQNPGEIALFVEDLSSKFGTYLIVPQNKDEMEASCTEISVISREDAVRGQKLKPGELVEIVNCAHVRLGDVNKNQKRESYVLLRCKIMHLKICTTRLDKEDRTAISRAAAELGAEMVNSIQAASVVVTNTYSTTMKCLTALVLNKTLVSPSFFRFSSPPDSRFLSSEEGEQKKEQGVASNGISNGNGNHNGEGQGQGQGNSRFACAQMLSPTDCVPKPASSTMESCSQRFTITTVDVHLDRKHVLRGLLVVLLFPCDEPYHPILDGMGAHVVRLYQVKKTNKRTHTQHTQNGHGSDLDEVTSRIEYDQNNQNTNTYYPSLAALAKDKISLPTHVRTHCLFFDEMNLDTAKAPPHTNDIPEALDLAWLTSGQVAQTVLQGKAQQPTRDHSVQNYTPAAKGNATSKGTAAPVDTAMAPSMPQSGQNGISINSHVRSQSQAQPSPRNQHQSSPSPVVSRVSGVSGVSVAREAEGEEGEQQAPDLASPTTRTRKGSITSTPPAAASNRGTRSSSRAKKSTPASKGSASKAAKTAKTAAVTTTSTRRGTRGRGLDLTGAGDEEEDEEGEDDKKRKAKKALEDSAMAGAGGEKGKRAKRGKAAEAKIAEPELELEPKNQGEAVVASVVLVVTEAAAIAAVAELEEVETSAQKRRRNSKSPVSAKKAEVFEVEPEEPVDSLDAAMDVPQDQDLPQEQTLPPPPPEEIVREIETEKEKETEIVPTKTSDDRASTSGKKSSSSSSSSSAFSKDITKKSKSRVSADDSDDDDWVQYKSSDQEQQLREKRRMYYEQQAKDDKSGKGRAKILVADEGGEGGEERAEEGGEGKEGEELSLSQQQPQFTLMAPRSPALQTAQRRQQGDETTPTPQGRDSRVAAAAGGSGNGTGNRRKFKKNYVRRALPTELVQMADMVQVSGTRGSDREKELAEQDELLEAHEEENNALFQHPGFALPQVGGLKPRKR